MFHWFGPFKRPEVYKLWTLMILFFGRVYSLTRQNYTRQFSIESRVAADWEAEGEFCKPEVVNKRRPSEFVIWQWRGFPKLWPILLVYEQFTTCFMLYIVAKHTMTQQLEQLIEFLFNSLTSLPPNCWLIGHTQGHASFNAYAAVTISLCHLAWRASVSYTQRPYVFDAYLFLLISDRDLEQFYTLLAQQLTLNDQVDGQLTLVATNSSTPAQVEATDSNSNRIDQLDSPSGRFLRSLLCYKIEHKSRVVYKLRPNRTSGARSSLRRLASFMFVFVGAYFVLVNLIIWSLISLFLLTDQRYLLAYPKCSPHLEQLNNSGALATSRWSLSFTSGHEVLATSVDLVENYFLWFDSTAALILVGGASIYLLNYDALLYWRQLDQKLHLTYARVRTNYLRHHPLAPPNFHHTTRHQSLATIEDDSEPEAEAEVEEGWPTSGNDTPTRMQPLVACNSHLYRHELELENAILELQTEFSDFFRHIELIDLFVSDVISAAIIMWLLNFSVFGHFLFNPQVYERDIRLLWVVISLEIFGLIVMTGISSCLLEVNQLCTKSYQCICSLMAYDQSKHKREFLKLLEYFTVKKRSAYTLFQHYPYTKTTYLSIFGWALSCFFVADGIYKR